MGAAAQNSNGLERWAELLDRFLSSNLDIESFDGELNELFGNHICEQLTSPERELISKLDFALTMYSEAKIRPLGVIARVLRLRWSQEAADVRARQAAGQLRALMNKQGVSAG